MIGKVFLSDSFIIKTTDGLRRHPYDLVILSNRSFDLGNYLRSGERRLEDCYRRGLLLEKSSVAPRVGRLRSRPLAALTRFFFVVTLTHAY